jgi:AraC-like DNA-binding protein
VARHTSPTTFHALGFSLAASSTLRDAFERIVRYYRLVSEGATVRFVEDADGYRISARPAGPYVAVEALDAMLALAVRLCRSLSDRTFAPLRVLVQRPMPADPSPFERCFRAPIEFDAPVHALVLGKEVCDRRLQGANAELARTNDLIATQALGRLDQSRVADRVRVILINRLPGGAPPLSQMARELATSARELQRRLARESTTYADLVDDTRRDLAEAYLREGRHSMSDIAYLLGFSGSASFTRAFRRWRGLPPSAYRAE